MNTWVVRTLKTLDGNLRPVTDPEGGWFLSHLQEDIQFNDAFSQCLTKVVDSVVYGILFSVKSEDPKKNTEKVLLAAALLHVSQSMLPGCTVHNRDRFLRRIKAKFGLNF